MSANNTLDNAAKPGLLRVIAAMFYDLWLVLAIWLLGATADTFIRDGLGLPSGEGGNYLLLQLFALLSPLLFFGWFWTHGGQTLGMRSWRIRVVDLNGEPIGWGLAVRRYLAALLSWAMAGAGFLWMLFDTDGCSLHDRLSGTRLVMVEKRKKD